MIIYGGGRQQGKNMLIYIWSVMKYYVEPDYCWMSVHGIMHWYRWCRNWRLTCININEV